MKLPKSTRARLIEDVADADLGDARRTARLGRIMGALSSAPQAPLPHVFESESDLEAAYRFLGNKAIDFDDLLEEHTQATSARAQAAGRVLVLHDTTNCSFPKADPRELGFLQTGKAGFLLHVGLVLDAGHHRRPLGVIHAEPVIREQRSRRGGRKQRVGGAETAKWSDREFLRWQRGVEQAAERLDGCQAIHVMDREGDSYALFSSLISNGHQFVIRCRLDRKLADSTKLYDQLEALQGTLVRDVVVSARAESSAPRERESHPARIKRKAQLRFRATQVTIARPRSAEGALEELTLNVVHVREDNAPEEVEPIDWILWATEPVTTPQDIANIVDIYRLRWVIEEFFKALKTGCSYEARKLESRHALLNMLAISLPIAVEVLWLRARAVDAPDAPANEVFTPLQLDILRDVGHRPLGVHPTAAQALLCLASLGGHQRSNGPPGWLILMRAYEKLAQYEVGWTAALRHRTRKK